MNNFICRYCHDSILNVDTTKEELKTIDRLVRANTKFVCSNCINKETIQENRRVQILQEIMNGLIKYLGTYATKSKEVF